MKYPSGGCITNLYFESPNIYWATEYLPGESVGSFTLLRLLRLRESGSHFVINKFFIDAGFMGVFVQLSVFVPSVGFLEYPGDSFLSRSRMV